MLEEGIVRLLNGTLAVSALCSTGGVMAQLLPSNPTLPSWSWRVISDNPDTGLQYTTGLNRCRFQIDVYGDPSLRGTDCIALARAINTVLQGFAGNLTDSDVTFIGSCFGSDQTDDFNDSLRSYRRMLEYEILYAI